MVWYYISDRTTLLPFGAKSYSRDIFATVYAVIVIAAFAGSMRKEKRVMTLSRQQTEEWKGWMQARCPSSTRTLIRLFRSSRVDPVTCAASMHLRHSFPPVAAFQQQCAT